MMRFNYFCFFLLLTVRFSAYSQAEYSVFALPNELTSGANSVVIDETIAIDVSSIKKKRKSFCRVIAVLNELGDRHVFPAVNYSPGTRVTALEAFVYDSFGNELEHFRKKDFKDVSATGSNLYTDYRVLYLDYTPTTYPYVLKFQYELESNTSGFLSPWDPLRGYATGTQKSTFKIKFDPANRPKYLPRNLEGENFFITKNLEEWVFEASNLKPIRYEEHGPGSENILPNVSFALDNFHLKGVPGIGTDWEQFGKWMDAVLLSEGKELPEATVLRIKSLVANETTIEGKARKIYQYVQDKVRYVSIQIDIGGWKPMPAKAVDQLSYGDCKALTNYTQALLDVVGVPSYYTVVYGGEDEQNIEKDFTAMQGNHVILAVPDGEEITWLECTSQETPYGFLGNFTDDRDVVMITPDGGVPAHTKIYSAQENRMENNAQVQMDENGNLGGTFIGLTEGLQYDEKYFLSNEKAETVHQYYKSYWGHLNGLSIEEYSFENDRNAIVFTEKTRVNIPNYANAMGENFLFCVNVFNRAQYIPPRNENRKQPLYVSEGFIDVDSVMVTFPENFQIDSLPENQKLESAFGSYELTFTKISENKLAYRRELITRKGSYPPEEYENFRSFRRKIVSGDKTKILLKRTQP